MTQEDKELLLKDLGARLPYGVISIPKPTNALGYCCWNQYEEIYANNPIDACVEIVIHLKERNLQKINKNLAILESVAEKLIGGQLHSGNVAHDAPTKGYTIQNCVNNIRKAMED